MNKIKKSLYVSPELDAEIQRLADAMGLDQTGVMNLAMNAGIKSIGLSVDPKWQKYFEKLIMEGKPLKMPARRKFKKAEL